MTPSASLLSSFLLAAGAAPGSPSVPPAEPVAIVCLLSGRASLVKPPARARLPLAVFQRLPAGATVEVDEGSRLTLVFGSGRRYLLADGASATLGVAELVQSRGSITALPDVPPLPGLARIRREEQAGSRSAAVRIRGERVTDLHPWEGERAPVGGAVLRFRAVRGADRYRVEIRDEAGKPVFQVETAEHRAPVDPDVLKPDTRYYWTVRTVNVVGPVAHGEAAFTTLAADVEAQRSVLRKALEEAGDAASFALLTDVDLSLGLAAEAADALRLATERAGNDPPLLAALDALRQRLPSIPHD